MTDPGTLWCAAIAAFAFIFSMLCVCANELEGIREELKAIRAEARGTDVARRLSAHRTDMRSEIAELRKRLAGGYLCEHCAKGEHGYHAADSHFGGGACNRRQQCRCAWRKEAAQP